MSRRAPNQQVPRIDARLRERVAHHEAAHFVAALAGNPAFILTSIEPHGDTLGEVGGDEVAWYVGQPKPPADLVRRQVVLLFAGYVGSKRFEPTLAEDQALAEASDDFKKARAIIFLADRSETDLMDDARRMVDERWQQILLVARALLLRSLLDPDDAELLLATADGDEHAAARLVFARGWSVPEIRHVTGIELVVRRT